MSINVSVDLGLRQVHADADHLASFVQVDTVGRQHGRVTNDVATANLLIAGIEDQMAKLVQRAVSPGFQYLISSSRAAVQLGQASVAAGNLTNGESRTNS